MVLGHNWFYRPRLDEEMKRYEALAFLQYLDACLQQQVFLPPYLELSLQQAVIGQFLQQCGSEKYMQGKALKGINWSRQDLEYSSPVNTELKEVEKIALFLYKRIKPFLTGFDDLKARVLSEISIEQVGILPCYRHEGWLLLEREKQVDVFLFKHKNLLDAKGAKNLETKYHRSYQRNVTHTPEYIKLDLVKYNTYFPNPATYFAHCVSTYPLETTYLPLVMEKLAMMEDL